MLQKSYSTLIILLLSLFSLSNGEAQAAEVNIDDECLLLRNSKMNSMGYCYGSGFPVKVRKAKPIMRGNKQYIPVSIDGKKGYMSASHLNMSETEKNQFSTKQETTPIAQPVQRKKSLYKIHNVNNWASLRQRPSARSRRLSKVPKGTTVEKHEVDPNTGWQKITYKDSRGRKRTGWMAPQFLQPTDNQQKEVSVEPIRPVQKKEKKKSLYKIHNVNNWASLRKRPSARSRRLSKVPKGATVEKHEVDPNTGWQKITYKDSRGRKRTGWMHPKFLQSVQQQEEKSDNGLLQADDSEEGFRSEEDASNLLDQLLSGKGGEITGGDTDKKPEVSAPEKGLSKNYRSPRLPIGRHFNARCLGIIKKDGSYGPRGKLMVKELLGKGKSENYSELFLRRNLPGMNSLCPKYKRFNKDQRINFWVWYLASMAQAESSCNPSSVNWNDVNGISAGELQMPEKENGNRPKWRGKGCRFHSGKGAKKLYLTNIKNNYSCGVEVLGGVLCGRYKYKKLMPSRGRSGGMKGCRPQKPWGHGFWAELRRRRGGKIIKLVKKFPLCR